MGVHKDACEDSSLVWCKESAGWFSMVFSTGSLMFLKYYCKKYLDPLLFFKRSCYKLSSVVEVDAQAINSDQKYCCYINSNSNFCN